uniref:Uncharacterized protein n=1 Tax=Arundo donax TaxID=35708 RepID=A0A0A9A9R8_ARUDO
MLSEMREEHPENSAPLTTERNHRPTEKKPQPTKPDSPHTQHKSQNLSHRHKIECRQALKRSSIL